jgi:hypothetical protein
MRILKPFGVAVLVAAVVVVAGISQAQQSEQGAHDPVGDGKVIRFGGVWFDPVRSLPEQPADFRATAGGEGLRFVQFDENIRGEWLADLRAYGIRPIQYYPDDTFLVWASDSAIESARAWSQVRWSGNYQPAWKFEPGLTKRDGLIRNVGVHFYNHGDVDGVLAQMRALGANILNYAPAQPDRALYDAWIEIDADQLPGLSEIAQVVWLEFASPQPVLEDEMSALILAREYDVGNVPQLRAGYPAWLAALGYNGDGVIWSVIDSGVDLTHPDFAGRIAGGTTYPGCPAGTGPGDDNANGGHGTHVAGIIGGDGAAGFVDANGFHYGIGVAPGVRFWAQNPICVGSVPWPPAGGWQVLSKNALLGGATGGNGSWTSGESGGTTYTAGARAWDQIVRDGDFDTPIHEGFTMVFSAGNSGPGAGTLTAPKAAKNPIITGGTQNHRVSNNIDAMYGSSSRGPTQDGRFGITIATPGQQIASARRVAGASQCSTAIAGTNNHYAFCTGTSMAAPHSSGASALLTQWWRDNNGGATPSPAMLKALLVNGAKDISGAAPIPNADEGWGRVDVPGSMGLDFPASEYIDQSVVLSSLGETREITFGVPEIGLPVKISLVWTDAAAAPGANPALVNNLDLEVETGGQTYLGNVFSAGMSTTGGSADNRNNIENVYVADPGSLVTIRIRAANLPGDGIPGSGSATDQDFALVCRNCVEEAGFALSVTPSSQSICMPTSAEYEVNVASILGYDEAVTLSAIGQPAGTTATFGTNPVIPPGTSSLAIGNTAAAAAGSYELEITGTSVDQMQQTTRGLFVATAVPPETALLSPADDAVNVSYTPTLSWQAADQAENYRVELARDAAFTDIVEDETIDGLEYTLITPLDSGTFYYWRVTASNACGSSAEQVVFSFKTAPAPGDCDESTTATILFEEDFTGGLAGFTTTGSTGASTWAIAARPGSPSGGNTLRAVDITTVSDQRLISPTIELPADQSPLTLQFWNDQTIEDENANACYDGGILEVSADAGATWTQIGGAQLLVGPYKGPINGGFSNPLSGLQAWCGDPASWANYIVDIDAFAGQTVQFRWRLGTDESAGRPDGWHLDDIKVQSCAAEPKDDTIFANGFEVAP